MSFNCCDPVNYSCSHRIITLLKIANEVLNNTFAPSQHGLRSPRI